jgi:hypothetical protein
MSISMLEYMLEKEGLRKSHIQLAYGDESQRRRDPGRT